MQDGADRRIYRIRPRFTVTLGNTVGRNIPNFWFGCDTLATAIGRQRFAFGPGLDLVDDLSASAAEGWSPITLLTGHTAKIGHLRQPTAKATGHRVIS